MTHKVLNSLLPKRKSGKNISIIFYNIILSSSLNFGTHPLSNERFAYKVIRPFLNNYATTDLRLNYQTKKKHPPSLNFGRFLINWDLFQVTFYLSDFCLFVSL